MVISQEDLDTRYIILASDLIYIMIYNYILSTLSRFHQKLFEINGKIHTNKITLKTFMFLKQYPSHQHISSYD